MSGDIKTQNPKSGKKMDFVKSFGSFLQETASKNGVAKAKLKPEECILHIL